MYYALAIGRDLPRYARQLLRSVSSLRHYNSSIPVYVFLYGHLDDRALAALQQHGATVVELGAYAAALHKQFPCRLPLAEYVCLPKYLCLPHVPAEFSQVLYVDCDTYWFADISKLFGAYTRHDCYAREEPYSPASPYYDPAYINAENITRVAMLEGVHDLLICNAGLVLMNGGLHRRLADSLDLYLSYVARFSAWLHGIKSPLSPPNGGPLKFEALEFPCSNPWIIDEVALWFTLGQMHVSHGYFAWRDVLQSAEFLAPESRKVPHVACHYYSVNEALFCDYLRTAGSQ